VKEVQDREYKCIGLRLVGSLIPAFIQFRVLIMGDPVNWGKRGPIMPRWLGVLSTSLFTAFWFRGFWADVTIGDLREFYFDIRHPGHLQTLDCLLDKKKNSN
jgi:hypothetical protein